MTIFVCLAFFLLFFMSERWCPIFGGAAERIFESRNTAGAAGNQDTRESIL
jgi:hypothetical protein